MKSGSCPVTAMRLFQCLSRRASDLRFSMSGSESLKPSMVSATLANTGAPASSLTVDISLMRPLKSSVKAKSFFMSNSANRDSPSCLIVSRCAL